MRTFFRLVFGFGLGLAALIFIACILAVVVGHAHGLFSPDFSVNVNGDDLDMVQFSGGSWLGSLIAVLVMGVVALVLGLVLPLVLLVSVGLPLLVAALAVAIVLAVVGGVGAVVCSPVILFAFFLLWLVKRNKSKVASHP
ncbi:MAG TPA: hypothetical protein VGM81_08140 [Burkholderiaceae bacterium]|jgi:hypothetical protein